MRKIDKKNNFKKVNMLVEQRYLDTKIVSESFEVIDEEPIMEYSQSNQYDLRQEENINVLLSTILSYLGKEKTNSAAISNDNKVIIYNELIKRLQQLSPASNLNNGENNQEIYTNNPEAMSSYLNGLGMSSYVLIDSNNRPYPTAGDDSELNEDGLGDYSSELRNTGNHPWTTFLGDKNKGEDENKRNQIASVKFKDEFNNAFKRQTINTTNGMYSFETLKFNNNFGKYDLIFSKPKTDMEFSDKMLWIKYDQSNGYYIDSNDDIELMDKDSVDKVIDMLQYNG